GTVLSSGVSGAEAAWKAQVTYRYKVGDKDLRGSFAAEGRKRVSRFGLTRMANDMEKIYDSIS
ncbi:MAG: hypothetical protein ABL955_12365, partial [Elusimicrobiota bacterium]